MANTTGQKFGGRIKGQPNKTTAEIRELFQTLVSDNMEQLQSDIDSLDPFQRLKVIIELSKFILPTLKQSELNIDAPQGTNIISLGAGIDPEEVRQIRDALENKY